MWKVLYKPLYFVRQIASSEALDIVQMARTREIRGTDAMQ